MSRPTLPYTAEEVNQITDPVARARARAELTSFIARLKRDQQGGQSSGDQSSSGTSTPKAPTLQTHSPPSQRASYRGRQRGADRGRGSFPRAAMHHPYQRPYAAQAPFKNNSVTFIKSADVKDLSHAVPPLAQASLPPEQDAQRIDPTPCASFVRTGKCTRNACRLTHDPNKVAICRTWLYNSTCSKGDSCPLSHVPTAHNVPTCEHFQDSRCNNEKCNFAHVRVNPAAQNCVLFGNMFYCENGSGCAELHAFECPYFANTGECFYGDQCRNSHVRNAAKMRKGISGPSSPAAEAEDDQAGSMTTEVYGPSGASANTREESHAFTQQDDYLPL